ncbi:MAG: hypothetical protein ABIR70_16350 [Bryobacteraceae bacterium]
MRDPVYALHGSDRLTGDISLENIELGISFVRDAEDMFTKWPEERWEFVDWPRDAMRYIPALSHASYLVRSSAARALGECYMSCLNAGHRNIPSGGEILTEMGLRERGTAGIAGSFLHGAHWSWEQKKFSTDGFDVRGWFLDTLRNSEVERDTPGGQTLEFYAHELFAADPNAISAMLQMGRRNLAVMTATQDPSQVDTIRQVLETMARSRDPEVSQAIQKYLEHPMDHWGTEFLSGTRFGNPRIFPLDA